MHIVIFALFLCLNFNISTQTEEEKYIIIPIDCKKYTDFCVISVSFGSKQQTFEIQVDTTTSYTWIPSTKFSHNVKKYDISKSNTGEITNRTVEITYIKGTIYGKACYDSIKISDISIPHFGFVLANDNCPNFKDYPQGKFGLGFLQEKKSFNPIQILKENNIISKENFLITKEYLLIGKLPSFLLQKSKHSYCPKIDISNLDPEYREAWACHLSKIFFGVYNTTETEYINGVEISKTSYINLDIALDINAPVIFDSAYPYINIHKKYKNYVKENLVEKLLNDDCFEDKDEDHSTFFVCKAKYIKMKDNYMSFLINGKMYYLFGFNLFKKKGFDSYELLIRFTKKNNDVVILGAPFLDFFSASYDYECKKITFFGEYIKDFTELWNDYSKKKTRNRIILYIVFAIVGVCFLFAYIHEKRKYNLYNNNNINY